MNKDTKWIIKVLGIPIVVSTALTVWFFIFQERPYSLSRSLDETHRMLIDPFIRSVSHLNRNHALGNTIGFFSLSVVSLALCTTRFYLINLVTIFILNVLFLGFYFQTGVGFSIVLYGICLVSVLLFLKFQYTIYESENLSLTDCSNILLLISFLLVLGLYLVSLVADFMIVLEIISIDNPSYMEPFVSDKDIYTEKSSQGHVVGSVLGVLSFAFWNVVFQRINRLNMFSLFKY